MKKVYLLIFEDYRESKIEGTFATQELAEREMKRRIEKLGHTARYYKIREIEVKEK